MNKQIDICILTYNRRTQLLITLENIVQQIGDQANILVLDNGSNDGTEHAVRKSKILSEITFFRSNINRGVCRGRNILWRLSRGKYIISLDDDIIISRVSVFDMIEVCERDPNVAVVSPLIKDVNRGNYLNAIKKENRYNIRLYEACFLLRRSALKYVGYLDWKLKFAGEGFDFAQRTIQADFKVERVPHVTVLHYDRVRSEAEESQKRFAWLWSFAYVYSKNFSLLLSALLTVRNFAAHIRTGVPRFGLAFALTLPIHAWKGFWAGRRERLHRLNRMKRASQKFR